jgi:hypothetical protein
MANPCVESQLSSGMGENRFPATAEPCRRPFPCNPFGSRARRKFDCPNFPCDTRDFIELAFFATGMLALSLP